MQAAEWWLDDSIGIETMLRAIDWWYWCYVDDVSKVCWAHWAALKNEMAGVAGRLNPIGHAVNALYIADCLVILAWPSRWTGTWLFHLRSSGRARQLWLSEYGSNLRTVVTVEEKLPTCLQQQKQIHNLDLFACREGRFKGRPLYFRGIAVKSW